MVTVASSETEAAMICGYLESRGIRARYDKGGVFQPLGGLAGEGLGFVGRQEILVRAADLAAARSALAERPD